MKNIVVMGAGFGGLRAATLIAKKLRGFNLFGKYEVVLVDRNDHHTYTPLLYEVATTSKTSANLAELHDIAGHKIKLLIDRLPIKFIQAEIAELDFVGGDIHLSGGQKIKCDYAVLALGSETNYFGIEGLEENSLPLKTFADAVKIREAIWNLAMSKKEALRVVVGGGGSTGVEVAGELKAWCGELTEEIPECRLDVKIIEAAPAILSGFAPKIVAIVQNRLKKFNVEIIADKKLVSVSKNKLVLNDKSEINFDILLWTGGVKAAALLGNVPMNEDRGRPVVEGAMRCLPQTPNLKFYSKTYGLGDSICFYDQKTGKPIPQVASAAISQAGIVAHNIIEEIKAAESADYKPKFKTYEPRVYPYIIPVGGKYAVAKIGPFVVSGFFGWVLKGLVELNYLLSIMPFWRAVRIWLKGLRIFMTNDRLG